MHERLLTEEYIQSTLAQQTRELSEMAQTLSSWLDGVHYPSEGGYFEYVIRSYLRRRLPKRLEVSTGFISIIQYETLSNGNLEIKRKVSRQFDIIVWDSSNFPPLFYADGLVVVMPESVKAIIEVTTNLNPSKMKEDLDKLDDLHEIYSRERSKFKPYISMVALASKTIMKDLLKVLEKFYIFDSKIPVIHRYMLARGIMDTWTVEPDNPRKFLLSGFIDSVCVLNQGFIRGSTETLRLESSWNRIARYYAYSSKNSIDASFGLLERDLQGKRT